MQWILTPTDVAYIHDKLYTAVSEEAVKEYEALQQKYELEQQCRSGAEQFATEVNTANLS